MAPRRWLLLAILGLAGLAVISSRPVISTLTRSVLYPAPAVSVPSPPPEPLEEIELESEGNLLVGWWRPARESGGPVVLMLHGNGENLETLRYSGLFDRFAELGAAVLALDYPGYGLSAGRPSEESLVAAATAALRELDSRAGSRRRRVVAGWSLGAAVAAQLAAAESGSVDSLALMSPWTALPELAATHFPAWLTGLLLEDRYDTLAVAGRIRCSTLVVHGAEDRIIPASHGRRVHAALAGRKEWVEVPGAGHNDLLARSETWRALGELLHNESSRALEARELP
jgi:pimeloyl-ACP methyl ester carboxylesterase